MQKPLLYLALFLFGLSEFAETTKTERPGLDGTAQLLKQFAKALGYELSRDVSHPTAIQQEPVAAQKIEPQSMSIEAAQDLRMG